MINKKQLRIGNYIQFTDDGTVFEVETIEEAGFCVSNKEESTWIEESEFEPIKLTGVWLADFGFDYRLTTPFYTLTMPRNIGNIEINPDNGMIWIGHWTSGKVMNPGSMETVHQLQNLYFALTGEELTKEI